MVVGILLPCSVHAQKPDKISVWVVAQPGDGGFVSPGVPDSVKDIKSEIPATTAGEISRRRWIKPALGPQHDERLGCGSA